MVQKNVEWLGSSNDDVREFPESARERIGFQLFRLQRGRKASDWKPMKSVGPGVEEIRVKCEDGAFRVFYVASRPEAIYVLHAFRKTTEKTEKCDIELGKARLKLLG
ncbi:type II toxin-antitoxin system RelE/ParE family toxin [Pseudomonas sp. NMI795_08]|uniref:type II toxin-antitoxin system RelE/ParE family toxin n=1 Tax=Pseudomonas sp. NMI795_08 TaxID=2903144 RepID=UPI001E61CF0B|nr:type II toxin-antitoxin system RelE/ParE family toxin [Pseudomonas sp. NMI795_08]